MAWLQSLVQVSAAPKSLTVQHISFNRAEVAVSRSEWLTSETSYCLCVCMCVCMNSNTCWQTKCEWATHLEDCQTHFLLWVINMIMIIAPYLSTVVWVLFFSFIVNKFLTYSTALFLPFIFNHHWPISFILKVVWVHWNFHFKCMLKVGCAGVFPLTQLSKNLGIRLKWPRYPERHNILTCLSTLTFKLH